MIMTMNIEINIEDKIRETGLKLFSAVREIPPVFDMKRWTGRIMDWAMKHEEFKIRLFRFIDVLPSLKSDDQLIRLLQEYFPREDSVPKIISGGIGMLFGKVLTPAIAGPVIRKSIESMARQFIAGKDANDIKNAMNALRKDGSRFSIDLLGEAVVSNKEAAEYIERYLELLDYMHKSFPDEASPDVSIKVSSLYFQLEPCDWEGSLAKTKENLRPILRKAKALGISVTFDMEQYYNKDITIAIFKSILDEEEFREFPTAGIALQAYLMDTEKDISALAGWARKQSRKIIIRLVKGAYWDYEIVINRQKGWPLPVFLNKEETDLNFERLTLLLFGHIDVVSPAIATHNLRSISHAIAAADALNVPKQDFEFQILYGMADPVRKALRERGFNVRTYSPVGKLIPGMAYLVRRLLENTSNESFLRKSFSEQISFDDLIRAPRAQQKTSEKEMSGSTFRNEPLFDFSISLNRRRMADALRTIKENRIEPYPLLIGDSEVRTDRKISSYNPTSPADVVGMVSSAGIPEADAAIKEARKAAASWRKIDPEKRAEYLLQAAAAIRKKRFDLVALEVIEVGKTWIDADADVCEAIDYLEYYGREMKRLAKPRVLQDYPGEQNEYLYQPKGIGVVIAPWNFPLAIATGMASAAIVAGNCVLLKPSSLSPVMGYKLAETFRSVGLPAGVLQFLPGPGNEVGEYFISHPAVDFIVFTGSKDVGLRIVQLAGEPKPGQRNVKRVIAEMGGKNAVIVDETADLNEAIKGILDSAFGYQGQKCSACSRLIVIGDIFNELCSRLVDAVASLRIGPPEDPTNFLGPVIDDAALKKIKSYIEIGKTEGRIILEKQISSSGYFVGPAIFIDASPRSRIATEEIFGPVLTIIKVKNLDEAIGTANESVYALTGGLFSRSPAAIQKVKEELHVGNLYINRKITGALVGRQPFGGFGMSGVGSKSGGPDYLLQFLNPVSISENTLRRGFVPFQ
jgi:RHH-type transcriptional regulator, proline utilization regulon repressor / proline dehydrogenase / delta 1-pyrroline-5-carboxylate dehydrogenase